MENASLSGSMLDGTLSLPTPTSPRRLRSNHVASTPITPTVWKVKIYGYPDHFNAQSAQSQLVRALEASASNDNHPAFPSGSEFECKKGRTDKHGNKLVFEVESKSIRDYLVQLLVEEFKPIQEYREKNEFGEEIRYNLFTLEAPGRNLSFYMEDPSSAKSDSAVLTGDRTLLNHPDATMSKEFGQKEMDKLMQTQRRAQLLSEEEEEGEIRSFEEAPETIEQLNASVRVENLVQLKDSVENRLEELLQDSRVLSKKMEKDGTAKVQPALAANATEFRNEIRELRAELNATFRKMVKVAGREVFTKLDSESIRAFEAEILKNLSIVKKKEEELQANYGFLSEINRMKREQLESERKATLAKQENERKVNELIRVRELKEKRESEQRKIQKEENEQERKRQAELQIEADKLNMEYETEQKKKSLEVSCLSSTVLLLSGPVSQEKAEISLLTVSAIKREIEKKEKVMAIYEKLQIASIMATKVIDQELLEKALDAGNETLVRIEMLEAEIDKREIKSSNPPKSSSQGKYLQHLRVEILDSSSVLQSLCNNNMPSITMSVQKFAQIKSTFRSEVDAMSNNLRRQFSEYMKVVSPVLEDAHEESSELLLHYEVEGSYATCSTLVKEWVEKYLTVVASRESDFKTSNSGLLPRLPTPTFSGRGSEDHVFSFLKKFKDMYENSCTSLELSRIMFESCLSSEVKRSIVKQKDSYAGMVKALTEEYGDPYDIIENEKTILKKVKSPKGSANGEDIVEYLETIGARLDIIINLVCEFSCLSNGPADLATTIYSQSFIEFIKDTMPKDLCRKITKRLTEWKANLGPDRWRKMTFKQEFEKLKALLHEFLVKQKMYMKENERKGCKRISNITVFQVESEMIRREEESDMFAFFRSMADDSGIDSSVPFTSSSLASLITTATSQSQQVKRNTYDASHTIDDPVCLLHHRSSDDSLQSPHFVAECHEFLKMSRRNRWFVASRSGCCGTCLTRRCFNEGKQVKFTSPCLHVDTVLACSGCKNAAPQYNHRPRNVLLCGKHKIESGMDEFMDAFARSFCGKGFNPLKIHNNEKLSETLAASLSILISGDSWQLGCLNQTGELHISHVERQSLLTTTEKRDAVTLSRRKERVRTFNTQNGSVQWRDVDEIGENMVLDSWEDCVFIMQKMSLGGVEVLVFYDTGANNHAIKASKARSCGFEMLSDRKSYISAAGDTKVLVEGLWKGVLYDEERRMAYEIVCTGMSQITASFAPYDLRELALEAKSHDKGGNLKMRKMPESIGGHDVGLLIGIKATQLQPELIFYMPSGLNVYEMQLPDVYGSKIAFGGCHKVFSDQNKKRFGFHMQDPTSMFMAEYIAFRNGVYEYDKILSSYHHCPEVAEDPEVQVISEHCIFVEDKLIEEEIGEVEVLENVNSMLLEYIDECKHACPNHILHTKAKQGKNTTKQLMDQLKDESEAGGVWDFRCQKCADCSDCKTADRVRARSVTDEAEQKMIDDSVVIDFGNKITWVELPFKKDPKTMVTSRWRGHSDNKWMAKRVLDQQCRLDQEKRVNTCKFMSEIQSKGFIKPLSELSQEWRSSIEKAPLRHYYPWRVVQNQGSLSTPYRVVVDPSMSGLNDCLPKGENNLCKLLELLIRFRCNREAYSYDIAKMYNSLHMGLKSLPFQLFLWKEGLKQEMREEVWVFVVAIYGTLTSGNQATSAIRKAAIACRQEHPSAFNAIVHNTYVDDGFGGAGSKNEVQEIVDSVRNVLSSAGFTLKVVTLSGADPPEKASKDGVYVGLGGYKWAPKNDILKLGLGEVNFNKKCRGAKVPNPIEIKSNEDLELIWPKKWTRRILLSKMAEHWDLMGLTEPIKADWKVSMKQINGLSWDEELVSEVSEEFKEKLREWFSIQALSWPRCVIPVDAVEPLVMRIIQCSDGATMLSAAAIYLGVLRNNGKYSCQLILGKSKISEGTIPRNELEGCVLATAACQVVRKALAEKISQVIRVTDSEISLCWISNPNKRLKMYVYNRIKEILRWSSPGEWWHIPGELNPADKATRPGMGIKEVEQGSIWTNGYEWMTNQNVEEMGLKSYEQIAPTLSKGDSDALVKEEWQLPELQLDLNILEDLTLNFKRKLSLELRDGHIVPSVVSIFPSCNDETAVLFSAGNTNITVHLPVQKIKKYISATSKEDREKELISWDKSSSFSVSNAKVMMIDPVSRGWNATQSISRVVHYFAGILLHKTHTSIRPAEKIRKSILGKCPFCDHEESKLRFWEEYYAKTQRKKESKSDAVALLNTICMPVAKSSIPIKQRPTKKCLCAPKCAGSCKDWPAALSNARSCKITSCLSMRYWARLATNEVKANLPKLEIDKLHERDGILFHSGRTSLLSEIEVMDLPREVMDPNPISMGFHRPVMLANSPIAYSFAMHVHWVLAPHAGVESTLNRAFSLFHIFKGRELFRRIRKDCRRCRMLLMRKLRVQMAPVSKFQFILAPVFYASQVDIAGPFKASPQKGMRTTSKIYAVLFVCVTTGATSILLMEDLTTEAFIQALWRHAARYGFPSVLFPDKGSQLVKGCLNSTFRFSDLQEKIHSSQHFEVRVAAVDTHEHGRVEGRIHNFRMVLQNVADLKERVSIITWETLFGRSSMEINNFPIAFKEKGKSIEGNIVDLITPNMFIMGRNPNREPLNSEIVIAGDPNDLVESKERIQKAFYELLLTTMHRLTTTPKKKEDRWKSSGEHLIVGDIVLFTLDTTFSLRMKPGRVKYILQDRFRKVVLEYRNVNEKVMRTTERAERDLVLLCGVEELDLGTNAHRLSIAADMAWRREKKH